MVAYSLPPSGAAGGDLAGSYPNPTVAQAANGLFLPGIAQPANPVAGADLYSSTKNLPFALDPSGNVYSLSRLRSIQSGDVTSVGTGQTASGLSVALDANATYLVDLFAYWTTANAATVTTSWTGPAGAAMVWGDTTTGNDLVTTLGGVSPSWTTGNKIVRVYGFLTTGVTTGNLVMTLASSVAASVTLKSGSVLVLDRVA